MADPVQCWPEGHRTRSPCEEFIPDTDHETMRRFGWGFVYAPDDGAASGEGAFYACPEHRSDCTEEERESARQRNASAKRIALPLTAEERQIEEDVRLGHMERRPEPTLNQRIVGAIRDMALVSQKPASFDAAIWDKHPRPWRVEEDWTAEVLDSNGAIVVKLPLQQLWLAQFIARAANP